MRPQNAVLQISNCCNRPHCIANYLRPLYFRCNAEPRKGNYYDNMAMGSFWSTPMNELIYPRKFTTRAEATFDASQPMMTA